MDPIDLRRKNLIQPEEIPYELGPTRPGLASTVFDSGDYPRALEHALERFGYDDLKPLQGKKQDGRYHGIGIGWFVKNTGLGPSEGARIAIAGPESVAVYLGIATLGQGHETVMAQICADALGVPMEWITVFHGSTDLMPWGGGTYSSRGTVMAGNAVHLTAEALKGRLLQVASQRLETDPAGLEFHGGKVHAAGTDQPLLGLGDLLEMTRPGKVAGGGGPRPGGHRVLPHGQAHLHLRRPPGAPDRGPGDGNGGDPALSRAGRRGPRRQPPAGPRPGPGRRRPRHRRHHAGRTWSTTRTASSSPPPCWTTRCLRAWRSPRWKASSPSTPPPLFNPLGVKGAGEGGIVACGAALANAVSHALSSLGIQIKALPLTPDRLRRLIREANP